MPVRVSLATISIANGAATSGTVVLRGSDAGFLMMPDAVTGTLFTFNVSPNGTDYRPLYDTTGQVAVVSSAAGSRSYMLPAALFAAHSFFITAGTVQGGARNFIVSLRGG